MSGLKRFSLGGETACVCLHVCVYSVTVNVTAAKADAALLEVPTHNGNNLDVNASFIHILPEIQLWTSAVGPSGRTFQLSV